jgi:hypothetical protein
LKELVELDPANGSARERLIELEREAGNTREADALRRSNPMLDQSRKEYVALLGSASPESHAAELARLARRARTASVPSVIWSRSQLDNPAVAEDRTKWVAAAGMASTAAANAIASAQRVARRPRPMACGIGPSLQKRNPQSEVDYS